MQDLSGEFRTIIQAFTAADLSYAVCGGLAFAIHVRPRATLDMDFLIREADLARCRTVLIRAGYVPQPKPMVFGQGTIAIQRFWKPQERGTDVLAVDLLMVADEVIPGVWEGREEVRWEGLPVWVVSRTGLVALKRLRSSKQDLADIESLASPEAEE